MKIEIQDSFSVKLSEVVDFISRDKPQSARKFKSDALKRIKALSRFPFRYKKSIYFENEAIRDMALKATQSFTGLMWKRKWYWFLV